MSTLSFQLCRSSLLLFGLVCLTTLGFSQGFSPAMQSRLQAVLESFQNDPQNPFIGGMSAAIKVEGVAQWVGATGYAARNVNERNELLPGGTPFLPETPSRIYSITKTFTAALVLELAAEGVLDLDAAIGDYIAISQINPQLSNAVTLRQLLAHESGFSDYANEVQFQIAVAFQPNRFWHPLEILYFVKKINEPGLVRSYSSTNYIILGAVLEAVTGKTAAELYRTRFFEPLHLQSMYLGAREPIGDRAPLAAPHDNISPFNPIFQATGQPTFPDYYTNISSFPFTGIVSAAYTGGGIVGNIHDLIAWGSALFAGRATRPSTIETMLNSIGDTPEPDGDYLGYGLWTNNKISETDYFVGHNGVAPGYRSVLFHQPDRKITIAILSNYAGAEFFLYPVVKKLYEALPEIYCDTKYKKVQLCYKGKEMCVAKEAVPTFLRKGAYIGSCETFADNNTSVVNTSIEVFPVPATGVVNIAHEGITEAANLMLLDYNGNVLLSRPLRQQPIEQLDLSSYKKGFYYLKIVSKEAVETKRLVVE